MRNSRSSKSGEIKKKKKTLTRRVDAAKDHQIFKKALILLEFCKFQAINELVADRNSAAVAQFFGNADPAAIMQFRILKYEELLIFGPVAFAELRLNYSGGKVLEEGDFGVFWGAGWGMIF